MRRKSIREAFSRVFLRVIISKTIAAREKKRRFSRKEHNMLIITIIAVVFIILDQLSKVWISGAFDGVPVADPVADGIPVIKNILYFSYQKNEGAAFGIMQGARWIFVPLTLIVCALFIWWLIRLKQKHCLLCVASGLMLAGAVGNLIDRAFLGYVRDFIYVNIPFATFNIADACLVVGTVLMGIYILFFHERFMKKSTQQEEERATSETDAKEDEGTEPEKPETPREEDSGQADAKV